MDLQAANGWEGLRALCRALRSPDGCRWDRAQTGRSLSPYLLEEMHELLEAIHADDDRRVVEELGDLLFLIVFALTIAEEESRFTFDQVASGVIAKMIRRHPHVFGEARRDLAAAQANEQWERIKREEPDRQAGRSASDLRVGARGLPALLEALRVQEKAASHGFDWPDTGGVIEKLEEERAELARALEAQHGVAIEEELGDMLFTLVNLARHLRSDPEQLLRRTTRKFQTRFGRMARLLGEDGTALADADLDTMEAAWQRAKRKDA